MEVAPDHDVFDRRHAHKDLEVLESPRQAMSSQHIGTSTSDFYPAQTDRSTLGRINAGHDVEQCCLAGAVGSDDRKNVALWNAYADVMDGLHTSKGNRKPVDDEQMGHASLRLNRATSEGTTPDGITTMQTIMTKPSIRCSYSWKTVRT